MQCKAVPMTPTANQGMVQTMPRGGPGQVYLPQYQAIPPPPPRTVFDLTPELQEPSFTLHNSVRSLLRQEMQSIIHEEIGTMIQGAVRSTFAAIKSEFHSDFGAASSASRAVYIQERSNSDDRSATINR